MKIYTKKGDEGQTSLLGGTRVSKHHIRVEAYGTVDELNAFLGVVHDQEVAMPFRPLIKTIQQRLFSIGAMLANDPERSNFQLPNLQEEDIRMLETSIDEMEVELPPLVNFVLPGGHPANSSAHVARSVCRRAERRIVELREHVAVPPLVLPYLNRLSDWLFVLGRTFSHRTNSPETLWNG